MRSDNVTKGSERAPNRSLFYALGYTPEELERPLIGVVSAYSEIVPGHMNLDKIADAVKAGVQMAGGTPILIPAIGVKNLSVIIPTKAQEEQMPGKWKDCCDSLHVTSVSPYGDPLAVFAAAKEIPADTDLILLDCIGYTIEMKERIQALTQKPVLLSRTLVARVIRELV